MKYLVLVLVVSALAVSAVPAASPPPVLPQCRICVESVWQGQTVWGCGYFTEGGNGCNIRPEGCWTIGTCVE